MYGQLGNGTNTASTEPVQVLGLENIIAISSGINHTLALKEDGTVWGWGSASSGQLVPDPFADSFAEPVQIEGLEDITAIVAGPNFSLAQRADGTIWAWGSNSSGQLGDGTYDSRNELVQVQGIDEVVQISPGAEYCLALREDGSIWAWGLNSFGQFGDGKLISTNEPVDTGLRVR